MRRSGGSATHRSQVIGGGLSPFTVMGANQHGVGCEPLISRTGGGGDGSGGGGGGSGGGGGRGSGTPVSC